MTVCATAVPHGIQSKHFYAAWGALLAGGDFRVGAARLVVCDDASLVCSGGVARNSYEEAVSGRRYDCGVRTCRRVPRRDLLHIRGQLLIPDDVCVANLAGAGGNDADAVRGADVDDEAVSSETSGMTPAPIAAPKRWK